MVSILSDPNKTREMFTKNKVLACWLLKCVCAVERAASKKKREKKNSVCSKHLIIKKKVRVSVCLHFVLFSQPQIWGVQYKQESHVQQTPDPAGWRLRAESRTFPAAPPRGKILNLFLWQFLDQSVVPGGAVAAEPDWAGPGRAGPPCSCIASRLCLLFSLQRWWQRGLSGHLLQSAEFSHNPVFTQADNKSTTFLRAADKSAAVGAVGARRGAETMGRGSVRGCLGSAWLHH